MPEVSFIAAFLGGTTLFSRATRGWPEESKTEYPRHHSHYCVSETWQQRLFRVTPNCSSEVIEHSRGCLPPRACGETPSCSCPLVCSHLPTRAYNYSTVMAQSKVEVQCGCAMLVLLVAIILLSPVADARPIVSGWDLSSSTGSSDTTSWRKFSTSGQAAGYHRLLLDLESSRKVQETVGEVTVAAKIPAYDFNNMDYAEPRSNKPGSSDQTRPPVP